MSLKKPPYPSECDKHSLSRSPKTALSLSLTRRGFLARSIAALSCQPLCVRLSNQRSDHDNLRR